MPGDELGRLIAELVIDVLDPEWVPEPARVVEFIEDPKLPPPEPCNAQTSYQDDAGQVWLSPSPALPITATLKSRIAEWRASPVANQTVWLDFNSQTCNTSPADHRARERETWAAIDPTRVVELREQLIASLERALARGNLTVPKTQRGTRGIVFTAGNADTFSRVATSLKLLRHYGSTLPAEVFHFPSDEEPVDARDVAQLEALGATVREVVGVKKEADTDRSKSFHIKGAAMVQSSYDEILMLDSDSLPAADVEPLFDAPGYAQAGVMLWPDFWREDGANAVWAILGVQCRDEWTTEAGQILINKSKHLDALWLVQTMLEDWKFWFDISDGDKDLFRYALLMLRKRWAVPGRHVASASWSSDDEIRQQKGFCGHSMIQHDHEGQPLFVHANLLKRILGQFHPDGGTWARTHQLALPAFPPPGASGPGSELAAKPQVENDVAFDTRIGMWKNRKGEGKWRGPPPGQDRKPMRVPPAAKEGQTKEEEEEDEVTREEAAELEVAKEEEHEVDLDLLLDREEDEAQVGRAVALGLGETVADEEQEEPTQLDDQAPPVKDNDFHLHRRQLINPLSAMTSFPTMADHLANPHHPSGLALLDAPRHVRHRALLEPRLTPDFWSGHRGSSFVLCVDSALETAAPALTDDDNDMCGKPEWGEGEAEGRMEVVWWRDSDRLKGFEKLFYEVGGKPNGVGF